MRKKTKKSGPVDSFRAQLSVVIPTRNERDNIAALFGALGAALDGIATEVVLVDDSDDETPALARTLGGEMASPQFRVQVVHRARGTARAGGLATAVDAGLRRATAPYVAVIDADLQHPPERLRVLYESAQANDADIVLATRYIGGGSYEGLDGPARKFISVGLKWVAKLVFPEKLLRVSDPLGGFFLVRRSLLAGVKLRPIGYKISLEILLRCPWQTCVEVPYQFRTRAAGASKSDLSQGIMVFKHMARLVRELPVAARFWKFCAIGASGVVVNLILFWLALQLHLPVWAAWLAGTEGSILSNFALHSAITWGDLTKKRWTARLGKYHVGVALSTGLNLAIFALLWGKTHNWLADQSVALTIGIGLNYWLSQRFVFVPALAQAASRRKQRVFAAQLALAEA